VGGLKSSYGEGQGLLDVLVGLIPGEGFAENVRIPSYGGRGLKLLKKRHMIFECFLISCVLKGKNLYFCFEKNAISPTSKRPWVNSEDFKRLVQCFAMQVVMNCFLLNREKTLIQICVLVLEKNTKTA